MTNCNYTADLKISPITDYTERRKKGARAFIQSNLVDCTTEVYSENELYNVEWKSKSWTKLSSYATRSTAKALRAKLELSENISVTFSVYAGCSCSCSPGYIIRGKNGEGEHELRLKGLVNSNVYGKIKFNDNALADFVKRRDLFNTEFSEECRANNKVAV
jgi:hypothetical protein